MFLILLVIFPNFSFHVRGAEGPKAEKLLLNHGSTWKYVDDGSDQGNAWLEKDFDDRSWKSGTAPLGYPVKEKRPEFGNIQTEIEYGEDSKNKHATSYFRTTFEIEDLSELGNTGFINAGVDDSVILYLNGEEIARYNLPEGDIPFDRYVEDYGLDDASESVLQQFRLGKSELSHLVEGTNVLAAEVHQDRPSSSDLYWDMELYTVETEPVDETIYQATDLSFGPGKDETEYNFSWYSDRTEEAGVIQYAKKSDMIGEEFPTEKAKTAHATVSNASNSYSAHKTTITNIQSATSYVYRLGDGNDKWTDIHSFNTQETDAYNFLFLGDPQIGSGKIPSDQEGWTNTLHKAYETFPNTSFILSAGDQVNNSTSEEEYKAYFAPPVLKNLPVATTVGNHDDSAYYKYHFNVPNESEYGSTAAGGNYFYTHGDALFMVLNSNSRNMEEHTKFLEETMQNHAKNWNFVMLHHSIYSAGSHSLKDSTVQLRNDLVPTFDKLEIDTVFMGHDHGYVRTHQMKADQALKNQVVDEAGSVINPEGTLYLTANSASGSKYYNLKPDHEPYAAVRQQLRVPTFSNINLTSTSFEMTTYRTDTMAVVDSYSFVKDESIEIEESTLEKVTLQASETVLPLEESEFYPDVHLSVSGEDEKGNDYDVLYGDITYKTDQEEIVSISDRGHVTIAENAKPGKVNVWAEVTANGKVLQTNQITIDVIQHEELTLLEKGSNWNYLDNGSDQGSNWRATDFDDSSWKNGLAPLGYPYKEDRPSFGSVNTLIDFGPDSKNKHATSYFRTTFEIEDLNIVGDKGYINFGIDDSVVLYLNGNEIGRFNLPEGEIPYDKFAEDYEGSSLADESRYETFILDAEDLEHLVEGTNVLAAEVHQDRPSSSDVYWDMEMVATKQADVENPETPENPEIPEIPAEPGELETPETPEEPGEPETPEDVTPGDEELPKDKDSAEKSDVVDKNDNQLPNTATPYFNWMFVGILLMVIALIAWQFGRKRVKR